MTRRKSVPSYRLHKQSGQAIVTMRDGLGRRRDVLLGRYDTTESRSEYARIIAEWEASQRALVPSATSPSGKTAEATAGDPGLTVAELVLRFWPHAE